MSVDVEPPAAVPRPELLAGYTVAPDRYDELLGAEGTVRPAYAGLLASLDRLGAVELRRRSELARRLLQDHGVTYNVYGEDRRLDAPWQLDPVPLVLDAAEWERIEKALTQRAMLLNRVLADCYGPQELIRSGRLPASMVLAQPGFLRPCHGLRPPQNLFLHLYAADLARSSDGRWWVLADRTQIPTGAGYALENRLVTSRAMPEAFRESRARRLAGYFHGVQEMLAGLAGRRSDNPRVVLLTPGPYNETYFEQAYLARYLGYTLVESEDLTVRDDRVFLKTLGGLEPVDAILRRVDDDFCDPLELRNESILGLPGLLQALRAGNVVVTNALGSGLAEAPALMAFLPGLCRDLLGQELLMPSAATWWCGQPKEQAYVEEHLDELVVKSAFRSGRREVFFGSRLDAAARERVRARLRFRPDLYVAQEEVAFPTLPSWTDRGLAPRPFALRVYLVASGLSYRVMPGGLARVAAAADSPFVSMQRGGTSKDTWVAGGHAVDGLSLTGTGGGAIELRRVGNNLSSRVASHLFWLGRYTERAEATSRLLRAVLHRLSPEGDTGESPVLGPLLVALRQLGVFTGTPAETAPPTPEVLERRLLDVLYDAAAPNSIRSVAGHVQRIGTLLRDRISADTWRILGQLDDQIVPAASPSPTPLGDALGLLNRLLIELASFHGLAMENMTRAQGWRFLDMGHRIERSVQLCTVLRSALDAPAPENPSLLEALLEVADSAITYHSRYPVVPNLAAVYDLLLLDDTNPRSLLFQLQSIQAHFGQLPQEQAAALPSPGQRLLLECLTRVRLTDPRELVRPGAGPVPAGEVARLLDGVGRALPRLSEALAVSYFAHSTVARTTDPAVAVAPGATPSL